MAEAPNGLQVEGDVRSLLDAFEGAFPDGFTAERDAAMLALCRRLAMLVVTRAVNVSAVPRTMAAWTAVGSALLDVPQCELCGGTAIIIARVDSVTRGSLPGLAVPCPACGGRK